MSNQEIICKIYFENEIYKAAWNKLWKKSMSANHDLTFLEGQLEEDLLWTYKCCQCLNSLYVIDKITYHYRVREDSIMGVAAQNISKHMHSAYKTLEYSLLHTTNMDIEIWKYVVSRFFKEWVEYTHGQVKYKEQYNALRDKFNYQPLYAWWKGKISLRNFKALFFLVLPKHAGYVFIRVRYWKNKFFNMNRN